MTDKAVEAAIDAACATTEWHAFRRPDIRNALAAFCLAEADARLQKTRELGGYEWADDTIITYLRQRAAELKGERDDR